MVEMIALRTFAHGGGVVKRGKPLTATEWEAENYVRGPTPLARLAVKATEAKVPADPGAKPEGQSEAQLAQPKKPAARRPRKRS